MKRFFTIAFIIGLCSTANTQIDFNNPPWETGCDSLTTQFGMNMCSGEKYHIADSILNLYYDKLTRNVDSLYQHELSEFKDTSDVYKKEYISDLKEQKEAIVRSKRDFVNFRSSTIKIVNYEFTGGTMTPMVVNGYALDLTVYQIKILENLIDEIIIK